MPPRLILLTGLPRSGTTLCCHLLNQAANTVALFEPMDVFSLPAGDTHAAVAAVADFAGRARAGLLADRRAASFHAGGEIPDNPAGETVDERRTWRVSHGEVRFDKPLDPDFTLAIKHNAAFTALLPELSSLAPCYGVLRNPLAVLASWNSLSLPVSSGRVPAGERLDPGLAAALDVEPDRLERQCRVLEWFFARFRDALPASRVLRYEMLVDGHGRAVFEATGVPAPPLAPLSSRNANAEYPRGEIRRYADRLLGHDGAWRHFYSEREVRELARHLADDGA